MKNDEYLNSELDDKWQNIVKLRKDINKNLEKQDRGENKIIGNSWMQKYLYILKIMIYLKI